MNLAHLHIVLNHVPSIGTVVGVAIFVLSLVTKNDQIKKISLGILVVMALLVLPTYLSGNAAQRMLRSNSAIEQGLIELHQNSAMITLTLITITGTLAWFGLWQFRRFSRAGTGNTVGVLIFSILAAVFILRTASLGGEIMHPEIRLAEGDIVTEDVGWRVPFETFANNAWVWPATETLHFIGMTLLFGVALVVNLRMLGLIKSVSFSSLHRLLPLGILGFLVNVFSGMVFFIASPGMYFSNPGFIAKILLLLVAGVSVIYFTVFDGPWKIGQDEEAPLIAKIVAVGGMVMLLGVMYFGRMLPFLRQD